MRSTPNPKRGDIVRVRLDPVEGSEQAGERPASVISPDIINQHSPVILVASIPSKKTERIYPFEVLVQPRLSAFFLDSRFRGNDVSLFLSGKTYP